MSVNLIVAVGNYVVGKGYPIGKEGSIPWHNSADLKWFKDTTMGNPIIMGRKTWNSLGNKPLKGRQNIIITTNPSSFMIEGEGVSAFSNIKEAICYSKNFSNDVFIIGGESIYRYAIEQDIVDKIYIDYLSEECPDADAFFPDFMHCGNWEEEKETQEIEKKKAYAKIFVRLRGRNNHVDEQYLSLVNGIIENGEIKDTRAGKTRSIFGRQLRFNLKEGLPILTTKKVFSKGIIYELLWFLKGDTNIKYLVDNNVHIWDDDAYRYYIELCKTKEFIGVDGAFYSEDAPLDKETFLLNIKEERGTRYIPKKDYHTANDIISAKYYKFGDLNRVYGAQWTDWGGHNQIKDVIETLKKNPDDRRMIISAWNVAEIPDMALPPCHYCCQFYTKKMTEEERFAWAYNHFDHEDDEFMLNYHTFNDSRYIPNSLTSYLDRKNIPSRKLSCCFHMRGTDCICGLPFNVTSYSILTHMIAQCVNMDVDELIYEVGDAHVYENHIEIYNQIQKNRNPHMYALPKLVLNQCIKNIEDFTYDDIKIEGYQSYPSIKYPLNTGLDKIN